MLVFVQNYEGMLFREALKSGCYDLQKARDTYRSFVQEEGMHQDLALQYAEVSSSRRTSACWRPAKDLLPDGAQ